MLPKSRASATRFLLWGAMICSLVLLPVVLFAQAAPAAKAVGTALPGATTYRRLADQTEGNLQKQVLAKWYPNALDTEQGGFYQNFREDWSRAPGSDRSIVCQSRLTWVAAQAAMRYPRQAARYRTATRHGLAFLDGSLWDKQQGGFFWAVNGGRPTTARGGEKHAYGNSFGIYAAVAAFRATHDPRALGLAQRAFRWLDGHAHDRRNGGYYEALKRDGTPILAPSAAPGAPPSDEINTAYGFKSMNTHIHLLEAFTALYEVWPDRHLRARLQEVFTLVRDRICVSPGCLNLFFTPDWRPLPDCDSFGHDVETAYLLTEASATLGRPDDARTWAVARGLVDHALAYGWDAGRGGFYDAGRAHGTPFVTDKIWWTQAEGLNALLLMHARYGRTTPRYWQAFLRQWDFIRAHQIDPTHGGWYPTVSSAGVPIPGQAKGDAWTEAYHQGRALLNVTASLRHLATESRRTTGVASPRRAIHAVVPVSFQRKAGKLPPLMGR